MASRDDKARLERGVGAGCQAQSITLDRFLGSIHQKTSQQSSFMRDMPSWAHLVFTFSALSWVWKRVFALLVHGCTVFEFRSPIQGVVGVMRVAHCHADGRAVLFTPKLYTDAPQWLILVGIRRQNTLCAAANFLENTFLPSL